MQGRTSEVEEYKNKRFARVITSYLQIQKASLLLIHLFFILNAQPELGTTNCTQNSLFFVVQEIVITDIAIERCNNFNSTLANIENLDEFNEILLLFNSLSLDTNVKLGLLRSRELEVGSNEVNFQSIDGTTTNFSSRAFEFPWDINQPDNEAQELNPPLPEDCVT